MKNIKNITLSDLKKLVYFLQKNVFPCLEKDIYRFSSEEIRERKKKTFEYHVDFLKGNLPFNYKLIAKNDLLYVVTDGFGTHLVRQFLGTYHCGTISGYNIGSELEVNE